MNPAIFIATEKFRLKIKSKAIIEGLKQNTYFNTQLKKLKIKKNKFVTPQDFFKNLQLNQKNMKASEALAMSQTAISIDDIYKKIKIQSSNGSRYCYSILNQEQLTELENNGYIIIYSDINKEHKIEW